jgi:hypothetical protein
MVWWTLKHYASKPDTAPAAVNPDPIVSKGVSMTPVFCAEGSRSRFYGHIAALSFIVQPCDEDIVNKHRWNETDRGKPKY